MTEPRAYAGRTLEERRATRREQLIETALDCLHAEGLSGISVRTICTQARLTPRYFYENFANLDELLVALVDHVGDEVRARGLAMVEAYPEDLEQRVRESLAAVVAVSLHDPRKASVVLASSAHELMQARQQQRFLDYTELVVDSFGADLPDVDRARLQPMGLFLVGGAVELVSARLSGLIDITEQDLVEHCTRMFLAAYSVHTTATR